MKSHTLLNLFIILNCALCGVSSAQILPEAKNSTTVLTIDALADDVLAKNAELSFYQAQIAIAKGEKRSVASRSNPDLQFEVGRKSVRNVGDGTIWSVSLQQTFDFPGRLALRKAIASNQVELAELGLAQFRATLAARARALAVNVAIAQQRMTIAREVADRLQALQEVLVQRDPAGLTPLLEMRILEANSLTLQRKASQARLDEQKALIELNQLRGLPMRTQVTVTALDSQYTARKSVDELLTGARSYAFELKARQVELEQQGFKVSLARSDRYGSVAVAPFYSEERGGDREKRGGISVSVPLPLWNRNTGNIEAARARQQQAETSLLVVEREVERQVVEEALTYETKLDEMAKWRPDAAKEFQQAAEEADRHYRLGAVPITTYVEIQKQYLEAVDALLDTRSEAYQAAQRLELLTGLRLNETVSPESIKQP